MLFIRLHRIKKLELKVLHNSKLLNKAIKLISKTKANYFSDKVEEHKENPKLLWKQFKTLGYSNKNKEKSRIILEIDNEKCFDPKKVVNNINNFFLTIASKLQSQIKNLPNIFKTTLHIFQTHYTNKGIIHLFTKNFIN